METLQRNLRWSLRTMVRNPGLTLLVVLSMGLAIGANTAAFSVVNAFLLRPLPIDDVDRVVRVLERVDQDSGEFATRNFWDGNYFLWKENNTTFEQMAAAHQVNLNLMLDNISERLPGVEVSADFFPLLGIEPQIGRSFTTEEDIPGQDDVVMLSHALWTSRFGADENILGTTVQINGASRVVVGVMPPKVKYPYESELWVPLAAVRDLSATPYWRLYVIGRLAEGVSVERANAELRDLATRLGEETALPNPPSAAHLDLLRDELREGLEGLFTLLFAGAALVLLIACANVSNLLLAQSVDKRGEVAVRVALGARQRDVMGQFFTYCVVLALLSGLAAVLMTFWSVQPMIALTPIESIGNFDATPRIDLPTLGFTFALALITSLAFGLFPALQTSRTDINRQLKQEGRGGGLGVKGRRILSSFVVAEIGIALTLFVAAGLVYLSFQKIYGADRGFDTDNVLTFKVSFPSERYPDHPPRAAFMTSVLERLRGMPGVVSAGVTSTQPLYPGQNYAAFNVEGNPATNAEGYYITHNRTISPDYLETLDIHLVKGRLFDSRDTADSIPVVLVSTSLAERFWPGEEALGKRVKRGYYDSEGRPWLEVVGVVETIDETAGDDDIDDAWYLPYTQPTVVTVSEATFVLKTQVDPRGLIGSVRETVAAVDPLQPAFDILTMRELLAERTVQERSSAMIFGIFAFLGVVLAALGIYGMLSFMVRQRQRELGVRLAMGGRPSDMRMLVLRSSLVLAGLGLVLGVLGCFAISKVIASRLYGVSPYDSGVLIGSTLLLLVITVAVSLVPAYRASKIDIIQVLRYE